MEQGLLIIVSGPSGVGKGTVCKALTGLNKSIYLSVSKTTRLPRPGEQDGVNYHFVKQKDFELEVARGDFLEYAYVYGHYYGTPRKEVEEILARGNDVVLEIDIQGALKVREQFPESVLVFLLPPSVDELYARIVMRGTESEESLCCRLAASRKEIMLAHKYDYVIINDCVERASSKILEIVGAERSRVQRNADIIDSLAGEVEK